MYYREGFEVVEEGGIFSCKEVLSVERGYVMVGVKIVIFFLFLKIKVNC